MECKKGWGNKILKKGDILGKGGAVRGTILNVLKVCGMEKRVGNKNLEKVGMLGKGVGALKKVGDCGPLTNYKPTLKCLFNVLVFLLTLQYM